MNNNDSPWMALLAGVLVVIFSASWLLDDEIGSNFLGRVIPTRNHWLLLIGGLILCGLSIYWMIVRRRAKSKPDDKKEDIPQEVLDFLNKKDADAKQDEAGPSQAKLDLNHTQEHAAGPSPQGEDKENPANKEETCMTENNKETENKKDT